MALERLASQGAITFRQQAKLHGLLAEVGQGERRLRLLMPQTYMNDSVPFDPCRSRLVRPGSRPDAGAG